MTPCPTCHQPASKRNGHDRRGRQKHACRRRWRGVAAATASAFSGYRWPAEVILTAVRWLWGGVRKPDSPAAVAIE